MVQTFVALTSGSWCCPIRTRDPSCQCFERWSNSSGIHDRTFARGVLCSLKSKQNSEETIAFQGYVGTFCFIKLGSLIGFDPQLPKDPLAKNLLARACFLFTLHHVCLIKKFSCLCEILLFEHTAAEEAFRQAVR